MTRLFKLRNIICIGLLILLIGNSKALKAQNIEYPGSSVKNLALKTNMLYDAALTPNIGLELFLDQQWSLSANWMYAWWSNSNKHRFWRIYGGELEMRKWLDPDKYNQHQTGNHIGLFFIGGTYDFEWGNKGYLSDLAYGVGASYGYSLKLNNRLNLDFVVGFGYLGGIYDEYKVIDDTYCLLKKKRLHYWGPLKAEISLVWKFGNLIFNK